jgi:hypothetical protein
VSDEGSRRLASVLRESAPADVGASYPAACHEADVSDLLPDVVQPCLVLRSRCDRVVPFAGGEHLAASSRRHVVPLDGRHHLLDLADVERVVRAIPASSVTTARDRLVLREREARSRQSAFADSRRRMPGRHQRS